MISERLDKLIDEMVNRGVHFEDAVREFEKRFIIRVLAQSKSSLKRTADALGIHRNTLSRKMAEHKIRKRST
jgi:Fis family transcriptional regulator